MTFPFWIVLGILIFLLGLSVYLALSGILAGRTYIGWALLVIYLMIYFPFAAAWYRDLAGVSVGTIFHILFLVFLIAPLGSLGAELLTLTIMPDPSKGLQLLKIHTEAEKLVNQDDLQGAIEEYERIVSDDPRDLDARLRMADLLCQVEEYGKAVSAYEALLEKSAELDIDRHCFALTRISEICVGQFGDSGRARGFLETIIETHPNTKYADFAKERLDGL